MYEVRLLDLHLKKEFTWKYVDKDVLTGIIQSKYLTVLAVSIMK